MSELRSVAESLRVVSLAEIPDAAVEEDLDEVHRACERLESERLRRIAEVDRRRLFERDGHLTCAAWLVARYRMAWGEARAKVRMARALERMPATQRALEEGEISLAAVRLLTDAQHAYPEAFVAGEEQLVEAARRHSVADLQRVAAFWRERVEAQESSSDDDRLRARRSLHASVTFGGMVRVDGDLDPETGETLLTALGAVLDTEARSRTDEDTRSPAQRRADALGEICRQWLDRGDRPQVGGERPHVTVTISLDALRGEAPGAELDHVGVVMARVAQQLACDASIQRVVLSPRSEPLDVGRRTPVVPPAIRRAVIMRDRHCRFPGCDRPPAMCDVHHIVPWSHGGPTSMENLGLLCRRHHGSVHSGGFGMATIEGALVFTRPDGSRLEDRGPPPGLAG